MGGFIPNNVLDDIRARCDIVDVISSYIPLKQAGKDFKALCPFHHEKTASFIVSPEKQIFHCFGCGIGGNIFSFVMKHERLEFVEAVKMLAQKAGVIIPQYSLATVKSDTTLVYEANKLAMDYYSSILTEQDGGAVALRYLKSRGVSEVMIRLFKLGYAPTDEYSLLSFAKRKGFSEGILVRAGLIVSSNKGSIVYHDKFRDRIIYPIFNLQGKVIGFGGRVLDNSLPKYMNSPETEVFLKRNNLYGLSLSKDEIIKKGFVLMVEGYMDLIAVFAHGFKNIVASLGTSLTIEQVRLLKRFTKDCTIVYDADQAGEAATVRGLDLFVEEDFNIKVVTLPSGFDPDSYIRKQGAVHFGKLIENAHKLFDYKLKLLCSKYDIAQIENKAKVAIEVLSMVSKIKNAIVKSEYIKRLAKALSINEESLLIELNKLKKKTTVLENRFISNKVTTLVKTAEETLVAIMLKEPMFIKVVKDNFAIDDFKEDGIREIVGELFGFESQGIVDVKGLIDRLSTDTAKNKVTMLFMERFDTVDSSRILDDCIKWIKNRRLKEEILRLQEEIRLNQYKTTTDTTTLMSRYNELLKNYKGSK